MSDERDPVYKLWVSILLILAAVAALNAQVRVRKLEGQMEISYQYSTFSQDPQNPHAIAMPPASYAFTWRAEPWIYAGWHDREVDSVTLPFDQEMAEYLAMPGATRGVDLYDWGAVMWYRDVR